MHIHRREIPILVVNLLYVAVFGAMSVRRANYEFVIYALVIIAALCGVAACQRRVEFGPLILWGLTAWGLLHMAGGHLFISGTRLYEMILVPICERYQVLKYDQAVHCLGFGVATLVCHHLLAANLAPAPNWRVLSVLVALMGMGVGAFNEVLELLVVLFAPQSGVGGYYNTAFDLVFNMLGALLAVCWLSWRRAHGERPSPPAAPSRAP